MSEADTPGTFGPILETPVPWLDLSRGPYDVEAIRLQLAARKFAEWPVSAIVACPQPKVYTAARELLAMRTLPYLKRMMTVLDRYDIFMDMDRLDFIIEMMDQELAVLIDAMHLEKQVTNVLLGYCAGAKKLKKAFTEGIGGGGQTGHDVMVGLGASVKIQADILELLGFKMVRRADGSKHPLDHTRLKLP